MTNALRLIHIEEPLLQFRYGQKLAYPRDGLFLYGPVDEGRASIKYGVIGTPEGVARFEAWVKVVKGYLPPPPQRKGARAIEPQHVPFPGFASAFNATWPDRPTLTIKSVNAGAVSKALHIANRNEAIKSAVDLYVEPLVVAAHRSEDLPNFWFVVIPEEVYELGRPLSKVPVAERIAGKVRLTEKAAKNLQVQPTFFESDAEDADVYRYATHFRRQLKARLLEDKIVTQIVRETTLAPNDFLNARGQPKRRLEDPATIAWKILTGAYYKDGGRPWQLADVREGVCYVGLAYKRRDVTASDGFACCAAQMFLSSGEGVVFRGALGPWFHFDTKQFHLDEASAKRLVDMVVKEYRDLHEGAAPKELFIHAKSAFSDEEWKGFQDAAPGTNVVAVQISDAKDNLKLFRPGRYPVVRGTALITGKNQAFLWTAGYAPRLDTYVGPETPNPLEVRVQRGECDFETVLRDVMGLTKINFNSCLHNDRLPVTIKFADAVGEVILAAPQTSEPKLPFKFYI
ncbi:MAG: hypothetical protein P4M09_20665 [Devosia sp.]|nr:hypothetical protein [Devosia sp.]